MKSYKNLTRMKNVGFHKWNLTAILIIGSALILNSQEPQKPKKKLKVKQQTEQSYIFVDTITTVERMPDSVLMIQKQQIMMLDSLIIEKKKKDENYP